MSEQAMREMTKDELIANSTIEQLADIVIMERQHIREIKKQHEKLVEMLENENKIIRKALNMALEYFSLLDSNDEHSIFLHDDFSETKWFFKAQAEL